MQILKIINAFENYTHKRKQMIEPIDKPIKKPDRSFKEVLKDECRKNQRGVGNPICKEIV